MKTVINEGLVLNCNKKQSRNTGKDYYKCEYNDVDLGVISEFLPIELVPLIKVGEVQSFEYEISKDSYNTLKLCLINIQ